MSEAAPMRVLHLASSQRWTGAAEPAAELAAETQRQGHEVRFACVGGSSFERRLHELGLEFVAGFHFDRGLNPVHLRRDLARLRELVASWRPDVVHCHLPHDHWTAALALRRPLCRIGQADPAMRACLVRTMHRGGTPRSDLAHRWLVGKGSDMVIAVSSEQQRELIEHVGLPTPRVAWVRGAVDLERFRPGLSPKPIREFYNIPAGARVAGMVARMQPHRGHHLLIDIVEEVSTAVPKAVLAVAGRGEIKNELIERIREHPLHKHLRRIGYRKLDLGELYAALDVSVLLVPGSDGTCRAMLEAMACGRPVIGARLGAIADTIQPGETGWLIEPGNRAELATAIIEALRDPERTRAMGEAARRWVETHHSRTAQYHAVMEVYAKALERRAVLSHAA